jgi:two-component system, cell cycle sensor histidine kinase and response regulator CckA
MDDEGAALRVYKSAIQDGNPFDLVILYLTVPGAMGGREAVVKLHEIDPAARVIVSSGYAHDPAMASCEEYGFSGAVAKPVDIGKLAEMVQRVLKGV